MVASPKVRVEQVDFISIPTQNVEAMRVADVAEARVELEARESSSYGRPGIPGSVTSELRDPDGNTLILHRRYAPRHPAP